MAQAMYLFPQTSGAVSRICFPVVGGQLVGDALLAPCHTALPVSELLLRTWDAMGVRTGQRQAVLTVCAQW